MNPDTDKDLKKETILWLEITPDVALDGMPSFEYFCKKRGHKNG
jgi:hypothetical protein